MSDEQQQPGSTSDSSCEANIAAAAELWRNETDPWQVAGDERRELRRAVMAARRAGATWAQLGEALGEPTDKLHDFFGCMPRFGENRRTRQARHEAEASDGQGHGGCGCGGHGHGHGGGHGAENGGQSHGSHSAGGCGCGGHGHGHGGQIAPTDVAAQEEAKASDEAGDQHSCGCGGHRPGPSAQPAETDTAAQSEAEVHDEAGGKSGCGCGGHGHGGGYDGQTGGSRGRGGCGCGGHGRETVTEVRIGALDA